jgi:hypothetical protein
MKTDNKHIQAHQVAPKRINDAASYRQRGSPREGHKDKGTRLEQWSYSDTSKEEHDAEGANAAGNGWRPSGTSVQEPSLQRGPQPKSPLAVDLQASYGEKRLEERSGCVDLGHRPSSFFEKNFYWLPFTPSLVAVFGPSTMHY